MPAEKPHAGSPTGQPGQASTVRVVAPVTTRSRSLDCAAVWNVEDRDRIGPSRTRFHSADQPRTARHEIREDGREVAAEAAAGRSAIETRPRHHQAPGKRGRCDPYPLLHVADLGLHGGHSVRRLNQREETGGKRERDRSGHQALEESHGRSRMTEARRAPWRRQPTEPREAWAGATRT